MTQATTERPPELIYVVTTEGSHERKAMADLIARGIPAFTPVSRRWRQANGQRFRQLMPIFRRYVFVASSDITVDFQVIRRSRFVTGVLGLEGKPKPVDPAWLAQFLILQSFGAFDFTSNRKPKMTVGQAVRIIGGKFTGYLATVVEVRARKVVITGKSGMMAGRMEIAPEQLRSVTSDEVKAASQVHRAHRQGNQGRTGGAADLKDIAGESSRSLSAAD
jgi:transcription antitermination factor NusG